VWFPVLSQREWCGPHPQSFEMKMMYDQRFTQRRYREGIQCDLMKKFRTSRRDRALCSLLVASPRGQGLGDLKTQGEAGEWRQRWRDTRRFAIAYCIMRRERDTGNAGGIVHCGHMGSRRVPVSDKVLSEELTKERAKRRGRFEAGKRDKECLDYCRTAVDVLIELQ
jgi:hypothetical protein